MNLIPLNFSESQLGYVRSHPMISLDPHGKISWEEYTLHRREVYTWSEGGEHCCDTGKSYSNIFPHDLPGFQQNKH